MIIIEEVEIWKDYDEKYKVSSLGKVWNNVLNRELKIYTDKVGYCRVSIHGKGIGLHRIIALTFLDNHLNKPTVNHKNAIKGDNRLSNLEWATRKEQSKHVSDNRLHKRSKMVCLLNGENIISIFNSYHCAVREFGFNSECHVRSCCVGDCNAYKKYKFRWYDEETKTFIKTRFDMDNPPKIKGSYYKDIYCEVNGKTYKNKSECARELNIKYYLVDDYITNKKENIYKLSYKI